METARKSTNTRPVAKTSTMDDDKICDEEFDAKVTKKTIAKPTDIHTKAHSKLVATSIDANKASHLTSILSLGVYLYLFFPFLSWFAFLLPSDLLPFEPIYSMDRATLEENTLKAVLIDLALLGAFMIPHNVFARNSVKKWMGLPASIERTFFVLQAAGLMHLQIHSWRDFAGPVIWDFSKGPLAGPVLVIWIAGAAFLFSATFALDHFFLFGISQGLGIDFNKKVGLAATSDADDFVVRWHYKLVAHPIMSGALVVVWATPTMTASHLLLTVVTTSWVVFSVAKLEEPQLKGMIGPCYSQYLDTVPRFFPNPLAAVCPHFQKGYVSAGTKASTAKAA